VTYAFSRYESGKTKLPVALAKLFKVPHQAITTCSMKSLEVETAQRRGKPHGSRRRSASGARLRARLTREANRAGDS